jgi:hypothetical protein
VQRRLAASDVDDIVASYVSGRSIDDLAGSYGVNPTTIVKPLDRKGWCAAAWSGR